MIIRTSVSTNLFYTKTTVAHQHKEAIDEEDKNYGNSAVILIPPSASKSKVANTTPKMSTLFNQSEDMKVIWDHLNL